MTTMNLFNITLNNFDLSHKFFFTFAYVPWTLWLDFPNFVRGYFPACFEAFKRAYSTALILASCKNLVLGQVK